MEAARAGLALLGAACLWLPLAAFHAAIRPAHFRRRSLMHGAGPLGGGALAIAAALLVLVSGASVHATLFTLWPGAPIEAAAMPLGALFWLLLGMAALALGQTPPADGAPSGSGERLTPVLINLLLATLLGLTATADARSFIALWQLAILLLFALTQISAARTPARYAAALPVALAGSGICMLAAVMLLDGACGSARFVAIAVCATHIDAVRGTLAFLTALAGCTLLAAAAPWAGRHSVGGAPPRLLTLLTGQVALYGALLIAGRLLPPEGAWWGLVTLACAAALGLYAALGLARVAIPNQMAATKRAAPDAVAAQGALPGLTGVAASGVTLAALGATLLPRAPDARPIAPAEQWIPLLGATAIGLCLVSGVLGGALLALYPTIGAARAGREREARGAPGLWILPTLGGLAGGWLTLYALVRAAGRITTPFLGGLAILLAAVLGLAGVIAASALSRLHGGFTADHVTRPDDTRSPSAGLAHARAEQPRALLGIHRYGRIASRVRTWAGSHYADERLAGPALPALFVGAMAMLPGGAAWLLQAPIHDLAGLPPSSSRPEVATMIGLPALGYGAHAVREMFAPLVVLACVIAASYLAEQAPRLLSRRRVAQSVPAASLPVALIPSIRRAAWWRGVGAWPTGSTAGLRRLSLPVPTAASQALRRLWASRKMSLLLLYWICLPALLLALAL